jgi:hypothetical protein
MSPLNLKKISILTGVIFAATLPFYVNPANALTLKIGVNGVGDSSSVFNVTQQINDNGTGDFQPTTNTLQFKQIVVGDFELNGTLTANLLTTRTNNISSVSLKLSQFTLKNTGSVAKASPIIRFEHLFNRSFSSSYLSGFSLFDGDFTGINGAFIDKTTLANYRGFFIPSNNLNLSSQAVTPVYQVSSGNISTDTSKFSFKQDLGIALTNNIINGLTVVGEVESVSLGAGETLSLPDSACMAIFNQGLSEFEDGQGGYNSQLAQDSCHPPETSASVSVPEHSSGLGIVASTVLAAGLLINHKTKKSLSCQ